MTFGPDKHRDEERLVHLFGKGCRAKRTELFLLLGGSLDWDMIVAARDIPFLGLEVWTLGYLLDERQEYPLVWIVLGRDIRMWT